MKADPARPIGVVPNGGCISNGIDLLTHMSIEFTKALLGRGEYGTSDDEGNAKLAIMQAKELIKQLNEEK